MKSTILKAALVVFFTGTFGIAPSYAASKADSLDHHMNVWLESSLNKVFPQSPVQQRSNMSHLLRGTAKYRSR